MDRRVDQNLQKVEALRARGDLGKARRRLADLAQEHPDTPPYRLELARACLDLGDAHAGLNEIRTLLRRHPDQRDDALALVTDSFRATGGLPAAQFLFEDHLSRGEHDGALLIIEPLNAGQLRQALERYATKLASLDAHAEAAPGRDGASGRLARWGSFHLALALKDSDAAAAHGLALLHGDEAERGPLLALLERRARVHQMQPRLLALLGEARAREGRAVEGLSALLAAAERDGTLAPAIEAVVTELAPTLGDPAAVLRTRGHLARLSGRDEEAVALYREAIAHEPAGAATLLELLAPAAGTDDPKARPYALLQVELLARLGDSAGLAALLPRLRARPWLDAAALQGALAAAPHRANAGAVTASAALLAIETNDASGFEQLLAAGSALGPAQTGPLTRALERLLGLPPVQPELVADPATGVLVPVAASPAPDRPTLTGTQRRRWLAALVRLHAAARDTAGVNARLPLLWADAAARDDDEFQALLELTDSAWTAVAPAPAVLAALLAPLAVRGAGDALRPWLATVSRTEPEEVAALAMALTTAASDDATAAAVQAALGDAPPVEPDAWALPRAAMRLHGDDTTGALHDLSALVRDHPETESAVLALLTVHATAHPERGCVALAAARMLRVDDRLEEALALLRPVFGRDPARVEEMGLFCESLLAAEPGRADIWLVYLDGLAASGRFRRLAQLLPEAERALPAARLSSLRVYHARLQAEEGNLAGALAECELALQLASPPLPELTTVLRSVLATDPGLARGHKLLGDVRGAAGDLPEALRALGRALRGDAGLRNEILASVRRLTGGRLLDGPECLALARFYLEIGRGDDAAAAYLEAAQFDAGLAEAIAADLADAVDEHGPFPSLLQPLARASRLLDRLEAAENACTALYARAPSRADWIFRELALMEEAHPAALPPVRARARILLAEHRPDDVNRLLAVALSRLDSPQSRAALAREFAAHLPAGVTEASFAIVEPSPTAPAADAQEIVVAAPETRTTVETADDPDARDQADRVAAAQGFALADRPLETIRSLRGLPLAGDGCRLDAAARARALWLLARAEEARGGWAAACACYRELRALSPAASAADAALNHCYGRLLQETVAATPLVLEKTAVLR